VQRRADGTLSSEQRYKPWGEKRYPTGASTLPTTFRFTGQRQEASLGGAEGLYYYGARWYDPSLGRFAQADSIIPGANDPQSWDRYSYVKNNPVGYRDPSGHTSVCAGANADPECDPDYEETWEPPAKNGVGHLTPEEKLVLAVLIMGETSTWTDTGYYTWIIWGLLNKISFDHSFSWKSDWSVYQSWQNEESGLISGDLKTLAESYGDGKTYGNTEAELWGMLLDLAKEHYGSRDKETRVSDKHGGDLADEFNEVLNTINSIEAQWYTYGPNSSVDPTHGGVGHVKHTAATVDEARADRNSWDYGPYPYHYSAASPIYQNGQGQWAFVAMNTPFEGWP
jgi:RHS repeat-associated protein